MAAVAILPMQIAVYELQMRNFSNISRSIVKTSDFMTLDLAKAETAFSEFHNFDELVGFKAEIQLPDINNLYFIHPNQTHLQSITKITFKEQSLPPIGFDTQQIIMRIAHFLEPLTISLYRPLAVETVCYCFGSESPSRFFGTGMINVDFTDQTADIHEIDLCDNNRAIYQPVIRLF